MCRCPRTHCGAAPACADEPLGIPTPARPLHWYGPERLLIWSSSRGAHVRDGESISYSGQYLTLWPWQPQSCSPVPSRYCGAAPASAAGPLCLARTFVLPCHRHLQRPVARPDSASGCATTSVSPKWPGAVGAPSPLSPPWIASPLDRAQSVPPGSR